MALYEDMAAAYEEIFPLREEVLRFLLELFRPGGGPLLDVGCGPGGTAGGLLREGLDVTGIDLDPAMIRRARERHPRGRFLVLDMKDLSRAGRGFRGAFCLGNVLSHLPPGGRRPFLGGLAEVLEPGSPWVVQTVNWEGLGRLERFRFPKKEVSGGRVLEREYVRLPGGEYLFRLRLEKEGEILLAGEETLHPFVSEEMDRLHREAGFIKEGRWGDFRGGDFRPDRLPGGNITVYRLMGS